MCPFKRHRGMVIGACDRTFGRKARGNGLRAPSVVVARDFAPKPHVHDPVARPHLDTELLTRSASRFRLVWPIDDLRFSSAWMRTNQNRPTTRPSTQSILCAAGCLGKPGMVITSPQIITTNSAPAASRTSRMSIT